MTASLNNDVPANDAHRKLPSSVWWSAWSAPKPTRVVDKDECAHHTKVDDLEKLFRDLAVTTNRQFAKNRKAKLLRWLFQP